VSYLSIGAVEKVGGANPGSVSVFDHRGVLTVSGGGGSKVVFLLAALGGRRGLLVVQEAEGETMTYYTDLGVTKSSLLGKLTVPRTAPATETVHPHAEIAPFITQAAQARRLKTVFMIGAATAVVAAGVWWFKRRRRA
jgi:hypothetical protein